MVCQKGDIDGNLAAIAQHLADARRRRVDILALPEMSITGYADPTRCPGAVLALDGPEMSRFLSLTRGSPVTVLAGLIERNQGQAGGTAGKPFITQVAARNGRLIAIYRKLTIVDEEADWFSPGDAVAVFRQGGLACGMAICADIANEAVFAACARRGARVVFELAAPGLYGEQATRDWRAGFEWWRGECAEKLSRYARAFRLWIAVATQAGRTADEDFPGGGYLFDPHGERIYATPDWSPGAVYLEIDRRRKQAALI